MSCLLPLCGLVLFGIAMRYLERMMPLKIYVAGSSRDLSRARRAMQAVRDFAHDITHDWCAPIEAVRSRGLEEHQLGDEEARSYAEADLRAIERADLVWMLAPTQLTIGFWVELGYALRAGKPIVLSGPNAEELRTNIFLFCQGIYAVEETEAIDFINGRTWRAPREWW